jgi:pimeloyl-ACP methyl ester carboxylesterase
MPLSVTSTWLLGPGASVPGLRCETIESGRGELALSSPVGEVIGRYRALELIEEFEWRARGVRWGRQGSGPAVVFCHGTPWSSRLWSPFADALSAQFTTYLWDMPGYGESSKDPEHAVSLDIQGELLHDLLEHWGLDAPHVIAHDYGGAVSLRAHLLHGARYASLALVDVVAVAPWGSDFFRLVRDNADVFAALPAGVHEGVVRAYIAGASHGGLTTGQADMLAGPWLDSTGQAAFYRQIAQADQAFTDEIEPRYPSLDLPVLVVWGENDTWIPLDRADRLVDLLPRARLETIAAAGHLIHLDAPVQLAMALSRWLSAWIV